jgi:hypothetical protein
MSFEIIDGFIHQTRTNTPEMIAANHPSVCIEQHNALLVADTVNRCFYQLNIGAFQHPGYAPEWESGWLYLPWDDGDHVHSEQCEAATGGSQALCNHAVKQVATLCSKLLDRLEKKTIVKKPNTTSIKAKCKTNRKGKVKFPKPFVYVVGKNEGGGNGGSSGVQMVYSHQWRVRGHWRYIDGIGKDFRGNYNQNGRTWVCDHIKGPDDKPLVEKYRIQGKKKK